MSRHSKIAVLFVFPALVCFANQRAAAEPGTTPSIAPEDGAADVPVRRRSPPEPFSAERFVRAFQSSRENVRLKLLAGVVRYHLGNPEVPPALGGSIDHARRVGRITRTVLLAVHVLGRFDGPEVVEILAGLLDDPDRRLLITTVNILASKADAAAVEPLIALSQGFEFSRVYAVRHALVCAMGEFTEPQAVDFLIDLLPQTDGQLKYETARQLARLTGENFGSHDDAWRQWWRSTTPDLRQSILAAPKKQPDEIAAVPWEHELPDFFSIEIHARQLVFVIDSSRSMLSSVNEETRLQRIQTELRDAIEELPGYSRFEVIAFNQGIRRWKGKLVPASEENKQDAYRFVLSLNAERKTACYDALRTALEDYPDAEALILLTDGHPTAGTILEPYKIIEKITELNGFRRISINAIGLDSRNREYEFLQTLAKRNFGKFGLVR